MTSFQEASFTHLIHECANRLCDQSFEEAVPLRGARTRGPCPATDCYNCSPCGARWTRIRPPRVNARCSLLILLYVALAGGSWSLFPDDRPLVAEAAPARASPAEARFLDTTSASHFPWTHGILSQSRLQLNESLLLARPSTNRGWLTVPSQRGFSRSDLVKARTPMTGSFARWCASEDAASRTLTATTVFEGKARSRSPVGPGGTYFVTFVVQHVFKDGWGGGGGGLGALPLLKPRMQVRLQFVEVSPPAAAASNFQRVIQCENLSRLGSLPLPSSGFSLAPTPVRANIKRGGKFLVFVDRVGSHNFTVRGAPLARSRGTVHAIRAVLCDNCVRAPAVWALRDATVKPRKKLRLVCRTDGSPAPAVHWYKDGVRLTPNRRLHIQHFKRKSALVIPRARIADTGRYECRAVSVLGRTASSFASVSVPSESRQDNTNTTLWPLVGKPCKFESYCFNGGTCTWYETLNEQSCMCADGYKGQRCENKDVHNRGSMNTPLSSYCTRGYHGSYYC